MRSRRHLVITAVLLCHLLLLPGVVTSQLRPRTPGQPEPEALNARVQEDETVTIRAQQQEKAADVYTLTGEVEIEFRGYILRADSIRYNAATGQVEAEDNVILTGGLHDEDVRASRAEYNVKTESGKFYDVTGTSGMVRKGSDVTLTTDEPFAFSGRLVEKQGREAYIVHDGAVTSCRLPDPKWTFNAGKVVVRIGDIARIYNSTFRIKSVPIFYFPFAAYPIDRFGRKSGFLVPTFGRSSRKGNIIGESYYWAINRSMDATAGAEYWSSRGWAQTGEFRARPTQTSRFDVRYFGVLDRGLPDTQIDQGGQDVTLEAEARLPGEFRGVISAEYLSDYVLRLAFTETLSQAVNSEVKSAAFVSRMKDGFGLNAFFRRYQNFQSALQGDSITILHIPTLQAGSVYRQAGRTPFHWSFDASAEGLSRREPVFRTNDFVGRFNFSPQIAAPLHWRGWSLTPEFALRETYYTERLAPSASTLSPTRMAVANDPLNRRAIEAGLELLPPALSKVFERSFFGRRFKHSIQPRFQYRMVNGINNFRNVIRFDYHDTLSDTNQIEYSIVNRFFTRRARVEPCSAEEVAAGSSACGDRSRDLITWELAQQYYFSPNFGGALVPGTRNVLMTTAAFTGISFLTEPRRFSPVISRLRVRSTEQTDVEWNLDYDTQRNRVNASTALVNYNWENIFFAGSHAFLQTPGDVFSPTDPVVGPRSFNQFRLIAGYGNPTKPGWGATANIGFDARLNFLQYGAVQTSYNWDCCGVSIELRRFALGPVRNENQVRFAFTLANVGTFGTIKRPERLF